MPDTDKKTIKEAREVGIILPNLPERVTCSFTQFIKGFAKESGKEIVSHPVAELICQRRQNLPGRGKIRAPEIFP